MSTTVITLSIIIVILLAIAAWLVATLNAAKHRLSALQTENDQNNAHIVQMTSELAQRDASVAILEKQLQETSDREEKNATECKQLTDKIISITSEKSKIEERLKVLTDEKQKIQDEARLQFNELASKILDDKTRKSDLRLNEILSPLKENIDKLKKEINDRAIKDAENHTSLMMQINNLRDLNSQIGKEAGNLAKALKGNSKVQGDWGEMILEQILSSSGLIKGEQFEIQATRDENGNTLTNENGNRLRPDVIVHLPDSKNIVIDSKTSLTAYTDYVNAEDEKTQSAKLSEHLASIKKHIDELASKNYQEFIKDSGDFVMMFVPNEGAYLAAMQENPQLWEYAYNKHVVIISPTHLISVLKLVSQLWSHDKQTRNAIKIAEEAGKLYDRFVDFTEYMAGIDKGLNTARQAYDKAAAKLSDGRANILSQVDKLKDLGAKAKKRLNLPE